VVGKVFWLSDNLGRNGGRLRFGMRWRRREGVATMG